MRLPGLVLLLAAACAEQAGVAVPGRAGAFKSAASVRAARRAYDGAPPVIPHENFRMTCTACHSKDGVAVPDVGFAPPMPHELTGGISALSRCRQCHVFAGTTALFRDSDYAGLRQDLRRGERMHAYAPPVLPHPVFMRENCSACHGGAAAREEIRTDHPDRARCTQCHLQRRVRDEFSR